MRLSQVLTRLAKLGFGKVGTWELRGRRGITLGDPSKYFPYPTGARYPVDTSDAEDPELTDEEVKAIERRFNVSLLT